MGQVPNHMNLLIFVVTFLFTFSEIRFYTYISIAIPFSLLP